MESEKLLIDANPSTLVAREARFPLPLDRDNTAYCWLKIVRLFENLVIAIHTAFSESVSQEFERFADQAVDVFLSKPVTREKLAALVAKVPAG